MKLQKIKLSSYDVTWIVLDDNHLQIKPITEFKRLSGEMPTCRVATPH